MARAQGEDFQVVLTRYANERLLFRLANSPHGSRFVLKGAALFTLWTGKPHRMTRDVDLLAFGVTAETSIQEIFSDVLALPGHDGVTFDLQSLHVGRIREQQEYGGVRVEVIAHVTSARLRLQVDIGFGDAITPDAVMVDFPALLDFPPPRIRAYPRETVVAEKLEAIVQLGMANSRMKDFYDLVVLARTFDFGGDILVQAIRATFERRRTTLPVGLPVGLTPAFSCDALKETQWAGFVRKSGADDVGTLADAVSTIASFAEQPLVAARTKLEFPLLWRHGRHWVEA
jgi:predicted nucleotidyltransferase component of viral defense system